METFGYVGVLFPRGYDTSANVACVDSRFDMLEALTCVAAAAAV